MSSIVEVKGLRVKYGAFEAVRGVDFSLDAGEILGIVGESGSGKTTIGKTLIGLEKPYAGKIDIRIKSVQMIFQDAIGSLNPKMKIASTLEEVVRLKRSPRSAHELLKMVGLPASVLNQFPHELSGGQCQRVSIARVLAASPELIIADEPVSALDVSVQAKILNLLRTLRSELGLAMIFIAHDLAVVRNICDKVAVMENGVFVDYGETNKVFNNPQNEYTRRLLAAVPRI